MDESCSNVELAETLIILTGAGARDAAARFASDCRDSGNGDLAAMWQGVVAAIESLRPDSAAASDEAPLLPESAPANAESMTPPGDTPIERAFFDAAALIAPMTYENGQMIWYHARPLETLESCAA